MFFSCSDDIPIVNRINTKEDLPSVSIENLKSSYTENGLIKAKLNTALLNDYSGIENPYIKFPKGIYIIMYDKNGDIESSMSAEHATFQKKERLWQAMGNVVLRNTNGDTLRTEKLYGDENEGKIYTNEFVNITKSDGTKIKGAKGFESNTEFTIYKFFDVSGKIFIHDDGDTSDTIIASKKTNKKQNKTKLKKKGLEQDFKPIRRIKPQ